MRFWPTLQIGRGLQPSPVTRQLLHRPRKAKAHFSRQTTPAPAYVYLTARYGESRRVGCAVRRAITPISNFSMTPLINPARRTR